MAQASSFAQSSLVRASIDIGRVLADRDGVTFRAQGTCMYPTLRPGDVLRIRSCAASDLAVGDIAVCRTPEYLFSHRVIATGERDGRAYVLTRSDRTRQGNDIPTFDDDLLGVVVSIERNGEPASPQPTAYPWILRRYYRVRLALMEAEPRGRLWVQRAVTRVQARRLYRSLARRWWLLARPHVRFTVRVPVTVTLAEAVCREVEPGDFSPRETWHGKPIDRWTLSAHVNALRESAAWVTFARGSDDSWRANDSYVRVRYRGTGLDDALLREADAILARDG